MGWSMYHGKVKWFNNAKGYGFIISDSFKEDLFTHYSSINVEGYKTLKAGQAVTFDTLPGKNGTHAIDITAVSSKALNDSPIAEATNGSSLSKTIPLGGTENTKTSFD